jgi:hypothetical protein
MNKLFGYRWSLYIARNEKEIVYALHDNDWFGIIISMHKYFSKGLKPVPPWSLHLNFNKKHKNFILLPEHFNPEDNKYYTDLFIQELNKIDPKWKTSGRNSKVEPLFVEAATKKEIKICHLPTGGFNCLIGDDGDASKFYELINQKNKEPTFYDIMDDIFGIKKEN